MSEFSSNGMLNFIGKRRDFNFCGPTGNIFSWDFSDSVIFLRTIAGGTNFATEEEVIAARDLRGALLHLTYAFMAGEPFKEEDLDLVNAWAAKPNLVNELGQNGITRSFRSVSAYLAWLALLGVELLGEAEKGQIRRCANPNCEIIFFDDSPTGRRKWCSMSECGTRDKANKHNRRKRERNA